MNTMIVAKVALVVLMFFTEGLLAGSVSNQCSINGHINGCSTFGLPIRFKGTFTPACNKHDVCYYCGAKYYVSKQICDSYFLADMMTLCSKSYTSNVDSLISCNKFASDIYYTAVDLLGSSFYEESSPDWCSQTWVTDCLNLPLSNDWWPS